MSAKKFYGTGLPGVKASELSGKLIVIEGADGSGRSTQITLLREWFEHEGFGVVDVGLKRSTLVSEELSEAKKGNILSQTTRSLFYATDFADQLENKIIPALRAGFIVLCDRYIYTLMARDIVRKISVDWLESLYSIALVPDIVFYLQVNPKNLIERNFQKQGMLDYWESGMDINLSTDMFENFIKYQIKLSNEFKKMQKKYEFYIINSNYTVKRVSQELKAKISFILKDYLNKKKVKK